MSSFQLFVLRVVLNESSCCNRASFSDIGRVWAEEKFFRTVAEESRLHTVALPQLSKKINGTEVSRFVRNKAELKVNTRS